MEKRFNIVNSHVEKYLEEISGDFSKEIENMYSIASKEDIPVIKQETLRLLSVIFTINKPFNVLELGSAIGMSSIFFSQYLQEDGYIDSVDNDALMVDTARENIKKVGKQDIINVVYADALDYLDNCNKKYDIIFIDAAKGQYEHYFNKSALLLNKSGLIIADNVLYRGMVAQYDVIPRRQKTLVKKLDLFLKNISKDKRFNTTIIPIGDGLSISVKL